MRNLFFLVLSLLSLSLYSQMPAAITVTPANATAYDDITITFNPAQSCFQTATLVGATAVSIHSGVKFINGMEWQHVVDYNLNGANGVQPDFTSNGNGTWSFTFNPKAFYNFPDGSIVTHICAVFNNGTNWNNDGRDNGTSGCIDFFIPLNYTTTAPSLTLRVNMNKQIADGNFNASSNQVWVEITGMSDLLMTNTLDGNSNPTNIYQAEITTGLTEGQILNYHFKTNTNEENLERTISLSPGLNSVEYWFNNQSLASLTLNCNMNYQIASGNFDPQTDSLDVAGSFNDWNGATYQLTDNDLDGVYQIIIDPISSGIVEFKFRINGDWNSSEFPGGGPNRVVLIPLDNYVYQGIYDNFMPGSVPVTFNCIMEYQIAAAHFDNVLNYLDVCGSYNNWLAGEQLTDMDGDEVYSLTIPVDTSSSNTFQFKFRINGDWTNAEFPGGQNRSYQVIDPSGGGVNSIEVWYNDLNPAIGTAPIAWDVQIIPTHNLEVGTILSAFYTYEDPNDDLEGETSFLWAIAEDSTGTNKVTQSDGLVDTYTIQAADQGKYIFLSVRPVAQTESGSDALGTMYGDTSTVFAGPVWYLSLPEAFLASVSVFPNPASKDLNIQHIGIQNRIEIVSPEGKLLYQTTASEQINVQLNGIGAGVHYLLIYNADNRLVHKQSILIVKP